MARTKQTARKSTAHLHYPLAHTRERLPVTGLLKLLGVLEDGTSPLADGTLPSLSSIASVAVDWSAVKDRLSAHPEEARIPLRPLRCGGNEEFPLDIAAANTNERSPVPAPVLEALIEAHPDPARDPRNVRLAMGPCASRREIRAVLEKNNPYLCGEERTRTFRLMGCPASNREFFAHNFLDRLQGEESNRIDWLAIEQHLRNHPHEAKIPCNNPCGNDTDGHFPLEIAVLFHHWPVPLSTVQLLLELAPEAVADPRSFALIYACSSFRDRASRGSDPEAAEIARAILRANPGLAGCPCSYEECRFEEQWGFPLHTVAYCMQSSGAELASELLAAYPAAIGSRYTIYDETPLELACKDSYQRRLSTDLLRILLEAGHHFLLNGGDENRGSGNDTNKEELEKGQMLFAENYDDTPLCHLARVWCDPDLFQIWNNHSRGLPPPSEHGHFLEQVPLERMQIDWDNYCLGLQAAGAYETRLPSERMWEYPLLQAAIRFAYRDSFVSSLVQFHCTQEDLTRSDPRGITPLLAAVDRTIDGPGNPEDDNYDGGDFSCVAVLELLLNQEAVSSQASGDPNGGGFRLHRALRKGLGPEDGTLHIADAFPRALCMPDPETGLIPFLLAAVGENTRVETIFHLMIQNPHLLASLCNGNSQLGMAGTKRKIDDSTSP